MTTARFSLKRYISRLAFLALIALTVGACGQVKSSSDASSGAWTPKKLGLPVGHRMATLDPIRHLIWFVNCPLSDINRDGRPTLVRFEINSGDVSSFDAPVPCSGPSALAPFGLNGSLRTDSAGNVWFLSGWKLVKFVPSTSDFIAWDVPGKPLISASAADVASFTYPSGIVVGDGGIVWVRVVQAPALQGFVTSAQSWRPLALGGSMSSDESKGPFLSDGSGRLILGTASAMGASAVRIIDPATGSVTDTGVRSGEFAITSDGRIAFVNDSGQLMTHSMATGRAEAVGLPLKGSRGEEASRYYREIRIRSAPNGILWLLDGPNFAEDGIINFNRVDLASSNVQKIAVPDVQFNAKGPGYSAPGGAGGLLFDSNGTAWLPTTGVAREKWPELYSLAP
ncbi:MAG TPA: hypothetical protein VGB64_10175 [Actinomycetota bacterium]